MRKSLTILTLLFLGTPASFSMSSDHLIDIEAGLPISNLPSTCSRKTCTRLLFLTAMCGTTIASSYAWGWLPLKDNTSENSLAIPTLEGLSQVNFVNSSFSALPPHEDSAQESLTPCNDFEAAVYFFNDADNRPFFDSQMPAPDFCLNEND